MLSSALPWSFTFHLLVLMCIWNVKPSRLKIIRFVSSKLWGFSLPLLMETNGLARNLFQNSFLLLLLCVWKFIDILLRIFIQDLWAYYWAIACLLPCMLSTYKEGNNKEYRCKHVFSFDIFRSKYILHYIALLHFVVGVLPIGFPKAN